MPLINKWAILKDFDDHNIKIYHEIYNFSYEVISPFKLIIQLLIFQM
jgi:hypothetical protein